MDSIKIAKFKAFEGEISIPLNERKNLLLYGENGAGKSSIYEALKITFFKEKIVSIIPSSTPENLQQLKDDLWSSYNNKLINQNFEIEINDTDYKTFDISKYQVFLISIEELFSSNELNLKTLLNRFYFNIDINNFCENHFKTIQDSVNEVLSSFNESVTIVINEEDFFNIKVLDQKKNIESKADLKKFFNEAKLNLVVLLILLNSIIQSKTEEKNKILVLDDFITSLDTSNRTFLIKYIFDNFQDSQILLLTHNISFYNLIKFVTNEIYKVQDKWVMANLYEINNTHKIFLKSDIETVKKIKETFYSLTQPLSQEGIDGIGNKIRKKFEILLYEYSKLVMIGAVEDSNKIFDRIMNGKTVYFNDKKTASDLINEIEEVLKEHNSNNLISRLQNKIGEYKKSDFENFQKILKELKLYQKVTLHTMSHGVNGMPTFTVKEIQKSLALLEKVESYLKEMVDNNVVTV